MNHEKRPTDPVRGNQGPSSVWGAARKFGGLGTEILASIIGLGLLGWAFDRWCQTTRPWFLMAGLLLGTIGGMYNATRKAAKAFGVGKSNNGSSSD